jgi:hypothetical protein
MEQFRFFAGSYGSRAGVCLVEAPSYVVIELNNSSLAGAHDGIELIALRAGPERGVERKDNGRAENRSGDPGRQ